MDSNTGDQITSETSEQSAEERTYIDRYNNETQVKTIKVIKPGKVKTTGMSQDRT